MTLVLDIKEIEKLNSTNDENITFKKNNNREFKMLLNSLLKFIQKVLIEIKIKYASYKLKLKKKYTENNITLSTDCFDIQTNNICVIFYAYNNSIQWKYILPTADITSSPNETLLFNKFFEINYGITNYIKYIPREDLSEEVTFENKVHEPTFEVYTYIIKYINSNVIVCAIEYTIINKKKFTKIINIIKCITENLELYKN